MGLSKGIELYEPLTAVDFTHPDAVLKNAEFYCEMGFPFVMGTTGDLDTVRELVVKTGNLAVIDPNMSPQLVWFMETFRRGAAMAPGMFKGWRIVIIESHQSTKVDTSGTARKMVAFFQCLGLEVEVVNIGKIRDGSVQLSLDIPEEYLDGHALHRYILISPDGTMRFDITHTVLGRSTYVDGTMKAIRWVAKKYQAGVTGAFGMADVLGFGD